MILHFINLRINSMNREIKYMAWDLEKRELFRVYDIVFYPETDETWMDWELSKDNKSPSLYFWNWKAAEDNWFPNLEQAKLMQFTWLRDKYWNDIYEGHIVEANFTDKLFTIFYKDFWYVARFVDKWIEKAYDLSYLASNNIKIEIVWHVYETPELYKKADFNAYKFLFE